MPFYAVVDGEVPGIYDCWLGGNGAEAQISGVSNGLSKKTDTLDEAIEAYRELSGGLEPEIRFNDPPYEYYAVVYGWHPGIYNKWYGPGGAREQLLRHPHKKHRGFYDLQAAIDWYRIYWYNDPEIKFTDGQE